jgi:zinc protease
MRALLLEVHRVPLVSVNAVILWKKAPSIDGLPSVLGDLLTQAAPKDAPAWKWARTYDDSQVRFTVLASDLEPALRGLVDTLSHLAITPAVVDAERARWRRTIASTDRWSRLVQHADRWLFAPGHPYHASAVTEEALKKMTAADLEKYRESALRPDGVTLCVAGDVSPDALGATLERVAADWKPAKTGPAPKLPPLHPGGALLVDEPDADDALVSLYAPAPLAESPSAVGDSAEFALGKLFRSQLGKALEGYVKRWKYWVTIDERREERLFQVRVEVEGKEVPGVVHAYLDTMGQIGRGELPVGALDQAKDEITEWGGQIFDGTREAARFLAAIPLFDLPLDVRAERARAVLALRREDVMAAAEAHAKKGALRVVALGNVAGTKEELEKMGLGKVVVENASTPAPGTPGTKAKR